MDHADPEDRLHGLEQARRRIQAEQMLQKQQQHQHWQEHVPYQAQGRRHRQAPALQAVDQLPQHDCQQGEANGQSHSPKP